MTTPQNSIPGSVGEGPPKMQWLWTSCLVIGLAAMTAYMGYSMYTQTGLGGYLMALQFRLFGVAFLKITFMVGMLILMLAAAPILWLAEKLLAGVIGPDMYGGLGRAAVSLNTAPKNGYSWKSVLVAGIAPLAIAGVVAAALYVIDRHDQKRMIYDLDLSDARSVLPEGAKFVQVKGLVARRYLAGYKERQSNFGDYDVHLFAPVTAPDWTSAAPVRFVLHTTVKRSSSSFDSTGRDREPLPDLFMHKGLVVSPGKLSSALPVMVQSNFKSQGLSMAPSVLVIDWIELPDRQVPASDSYLIALFVGAAFSLVTFLIMPIVKLGESWRKKRELRQVS